MLRSRSSTGCAPAGYRPDDDVAELDLAAAVTNGRTHPGGLGPGSRDHVHDQHAREPEALVDRVRSELDAKGRPPDAAVGDQVGHHPVDGVDRDCEPDPGVAAGRADDGGVDPDQAA
jgi:hypothetical protein